MCGVMLVGGEVCGELGLGLGIPLGGSLCGFVCICLNHF